MRFPKKTVSHSSLSMRVLSATGVFGGTQAVMILCSLARIKFVALWLGAAGVGLFSLYNAAVELMASLTQLGLRGASVRDIAAADSPVRARLCGSVRRWAWLFGLVGAFITLSAASPLSRLTFGDENHVPGFMWLSATMLLSSLTAGEMAVMQGCGMLKRLAGASLWGAVGGLAISVPLFYFLRIDSIIPSIIAYSVSTLAAAAIMGPRSVKPTVSCRQTLSDGVGFLKLGSWMTVSAFTAVFAHYALAVYINSRGGMSETGYFQAGYSLVSRYGAVMLASVGMEFYPRITSHIGSRRITSVYVSHEVAMLSCILIPAVVLFVVLRHFIVWLLYTPDFYCIETYIAWGVAGLTFRAASWCMAYVIVARGDGLIYLFTEVASAIVYFFASVLLYERYGLDGAGYAYIAWYCMYVFIVGTVYFGRYGMSMSQHAVGLMCLSVVAGTLSVLAVECIG